MSTSDSHINSIKNRWWMPLSASVVIPAAAVYLWGWAEPGAHTPPRTNSPAAAGDTPFDLQTIPVATKGTIALDPGHDGFIKQKDGSIKRDHGTEGEYLGQTVEEAHANWLLVQDIKFHLELLGYKVVLTRETEEPSANGESEVDELANGDATPMARRRTSVAPDAIAFISIHQDHRPKNDRGLQVNYRSDGRPVDKKFAQVVASLAGGETVDSTRGLAVLSPAFHRAIGFPIERPAILIEAGNFANTEDIAKVMDPVQRKQLAQTIADAIDKGLNSPGLKLVEKFQRFVTALSASKAEITYKQTVATFDLATGTFDLPDGESFFAGSGLGSGRNNPRMENVKDGGPVPLGLWRVGPVAWHSYHLANGHTDRSLSMTLSPLMVSHTFGRGGFLLHHTHQSDKSLESEGCITLSDADMGKVIAARQRGAFDEVRVIYDRTGSQYAAQSTRPYDVMSPSVRSAMKLAAR